MGLHSGSGRADLAPLQYRYEAVLKHFGDLTNRHALLNTSFNLHGEPIVCTAEDAVSVFANSGLDHMVLGPLLVSKRRENTC